MRKVTRFLRADDFKKKITDAMKQEKISQNDLAICLGIPQRTLQGWTETEGDAPLIPIEYFYVLSKLLHVSMEYWCECEEADNEVTVALTTRRAQIYTHEEEKSGRQMRRGNK